MNCVEDCVAIIFTRGAVCTGITPGCGETCDIADLGEFSDCVDTTSGLVNICDGITPGRGDDGGDKLSGGVIGWVFCSVCVGCTFD